MDIEKLKRLSAAVIDWANCSKAWLDTSEDVAAAVVGHIDYDGNTYPVAVVDCDQYYSGDSLALANFYAAANPAAMLELIAEVERLQAENERLRKIDTAARNLLDQRGRHNTEIAYRRLEAVVKGE